MATGKELNAAERKGLEFFATPGAIRGPGKITITGNMFGNRITIDLGQRDQYGTAKIVKQSWIKEDPAQTVPVKKNLFTKLFKGK